MGFVALLRLSLHTGCGGLLTGLVDAFGLLFVGGCGCCCRRCCSLEARWHRDGELVVVRSSAESIGEAAHVGALLAVQPVGGRVREIDLCLWISWLWLLLLLLLLVHQTRLQVNAVVSESLSWLLKVLLIQLVLLSR